MPLKFLIDLLSGNLVLVNIPGTAPVSTGTFLFTDSSNFSFADGTNIDFIT